MKTLPKPRPCTRFCPLIVAALAAAAQAIAPSVARADALTALAPTDKLVAQQRLQTFTRSAHIGTPHRLEAEFAYRAAFLTTNVAALNVLEEKGSASLHTGDLLLTYAPIDSFELSLGWNMFESYRVPQLDVAETVAGEPYLDLKYRLPFKVAARQHGLALFAELRPQIGQDDGEGLDIELDGIYSARVSKVLLSAQAGVQINTAASPAALRVPLSFLAEANVHPLVNVYGEFIENLNTEDLSQSATMLRAGVALYPFPGLRFDISGGPGLTTSTPDGFVGFGLTFLSNELRTDPASPF
jgi:hypothetical protein